MTVDLIDHNVYLSDVLDALYWRGPRLSVMFHDEHQKVRDEKDYGHNDGDTIVPLLLVKNNREIVTKENLELCAKAVDHLLAAHGRVLVHCMFGMERSPLVVTYWLSTRHQLRWSEAWDLVKQKRPCVQDSTDWLSKVTRKELGTTYIPMELR